VCSVYRDPARSDVAKIQMFRRDLAATPDADPFGPIDQRIADDAVDALTRDTLR